MSNSIFLNDLRLLRPLKLSDLELLSSYYGKHNPGLSYYNPVAAMIWRDVDEIYILPNGTLFDHRREMLSLPFDKNLSLEELLELSNALRAEGYSGDFGPLTPPMIAHLPYEELLKDFIIVQIEGDGDYIYSIEKLALLKGHKLQKKKNLIKQFDTAFPQIQIGTLTKQDGGRCIELAKLWCFQCGKCDEPQIDKEFKAIEESFTHFEELNLQGLKVSVDKGDLIAFSLFSELNKEMVNVHFEKSNLQIKGAAQKMNQVVATYLHEKNYLYLNREQDLNDEGLRQAKRSYDPLEVKTIIRLKRREQKKEF